MFPENDPQSQNPYSAAFDEGPDPLQVKGDFIPTRVEAGDVLSHAWEMCKIHWGTIIAGMIVVGLINLGFQWAGEFILVGLNGGANVLVQQGQQLNPAMWIMTGTAPPLAIVLWLLMLGIGRFFEIGLLQMVQTAARGESPQISQVFGGGPWYWRYLGAYILFSIAYMFGFALLIIPGILITLMWWPVLQLIVDNKAGTLDAFSRASEMTKGNWGTAFVLFLATFGITILGALACLVGLLFAIPLVQLVWCSAYLMMSGQIGRVPVQQGPADYGYGEGFQA